MPKADMTVAVIACTAFWSAMFALWCLAGQEWHHAAWAGLAAAALSVEAQGRVE